MADRQSTTELRTALRAAYAGPASRTAAAAVLRDTPPELIERAYVETLRDTQAMAGAMLQFMAMPVADGDVQRWGQHFHALLWSAALEEQRALARTRASALDPTPIPEMPR